MIVDNFTHSVETGGNVMSKDVRGNSWDSLNPVSKISFAVAIAAFGTALLGLVINQIFTGWMAAGGMAGVGLFYLAIGILNLEWRSSPVTEDQKDEEAMVANTLHMPSVADTSGMTGERVRRTPHVDHKHSREKELVGTRD